MTVEPLFKGLVNDEDGHLVGTSVIGDESFYVVDDAGFKRHIPSAQVDRQVLASMRGQIEGNEDLLADQTMKMMGQDDIFTRAVVSNQLKNLDQQFDQLFQTGIPEEARAYLGMVGFKVIINLHGEVLEVIQPSAQAPEDE